MKQYLIILLILCFYEASAQNYNNIASTRTTFFKHTSVLLRGYKYDSVKVIGTDSAFYAPRVIIRNLSSPWACADTSNGPVLSMMIRKRPDGWFVFQDRNTDSIKFKSNANLNESWVCRPLPFNGLLKAKVTDIRTDSVIDTVDQVKEITFNAEYLNGTVYPHIINGVKIRLSKHYGFTKTIDWNLFPNDTLGWYLKGKGSPKIGLQDFTVAECYDYQPGDIFHITTSISRLGVTVFYKTIKTILSRINLGSDTVVYISEICKVKTVSHPPPNVTKWMDTITETIIYDDYELTSKINRIPDQFTPTYGTHRTASRYYKMEAGFNGHPSKVVALDDYCMNGCWMEYCGETNYTQENFAKGLGRYYYWHNEINGGSVDNQEESLVYYKKGDEEWGTPLAQNCQVLLGVEAKISPASMKITINPNPIRTIALIDSGQPRTSATSFYTLFDMMGRLVKTGICNGVEFIFDRSGIGSGCYLLKLTDEKGGNARQTKMMIN